MGLRRARVASVSKVLRGRLLLGSLTRPAPLLRSQLLVNDLGEDEHGLGEVRGVLQRPIGRSRHTVAVVGLGKAHRCFWVEAFEYGPYFG
jgi:hypothetical protein